MNRIVLYNQDIVIIFRCSNATAFRKMKFIRSELKKQPHQVVTIDEFCKFFDLPKSEVENAIFRKST